MGIGLLFAQDTAALSGCPILLDLWQPKRIHENSELSDRILEYRGATIHYNFPGELRADNLVWADQLCGWWP
jgi:hypothetical protein